MSPPEAAAAQRYGSAEHYKARLAEVSAENDRLRVELDRLGEVIARAREVVVELKEVQVTDRELDALAEMLNG